LNLNSRATCPLPPSHSPIAHEPVLTAETETRAAAGCCWLLLPRVLGAADSTLAASALRQQGMSADSQDLLLRLFDTDGDGQISYREFLGFSEDALAA
jgi:hypothetical protein